MIHKVGIIGAGANAQMHLTGYQYLDNVDVIAVADINEQALIGMNKIWGITSLYKDYKEMLKRKDIEIIVISVPEIAPNIPDLHAKVAIDVCKSGKHVLCEKPLAQSLKGAKNILSAAKKADIKFMVGQNFRWFPKYDAVKKLMEKKLIGKPLALYFEDFRWQESWQAQYGPSWRDLLDRFLMLKDCIHFVDLFHWWLERDAVSVYAITNTSPYMKSLGIKGETNVIMILDYGDCIGQINFCWYSHSSWNERLRIIGTDGNIEYTDKLWLKNKFGDLFEPEIYVPIGPALKDNETQLEVSREKSKWELPWSMSVEMKKLIEAIENDHEPIVSIDDNLGVLKTVFACYDSARTKKTIKIGN